MTQIKQPSFDTYSAGSRQYRKRKQTKAQTNEKASGIRTRAKRGEKKKGKQQAEKERQKRQGKRILTNL